MHSTEESNISAWKESGTLYLTQYEEYELWHQKWRLYMNYDQEQSLEYLFTKRGIEYPTFTKSIS